MRILLCALLVACVASGNAACARQTPQSSVTRVSTAETTLTAMFIDSGALEVAARSAFQRSGAEIWQGWAENPAFGQLESTKQEAIRLYLVSEYPEEATTDVTSHAPALIQEIAPRLADMFDEQELLAITDFVRSEGGRTWFLRTVSAGAEVTPSSQEQRALDELARTLAGGDQNQEFNDFLYEMSQQMIVSRAPAIRERLTLRICEMLASDRSMWSACSN